MGVQGMQKKPYPQLLRLQQALVAAKLVDAGAIAIATRETNPDPKKLPDIIQHKIRAARIDQIEASIKTWI